MIKTISKLIIGSGMLLMILTQVAIAQGINFQDNLEAALKQAKQENKLVFVDFYTSWCGPCKAMAADVFPQAEVGAYFNKEFVSVKIQCDDTGYGVALGKQYKIAAYPTLMFLDAQGETVHSVAGGLSPKGLIELGKTALDPSKNQLAMVKQWDAGNREPAFMQRYFQTLMRSYRAEKAQADFEAYFKQLAKAEKASKKTFDLMQVVKVGPFTSSFDYMEANKADYYKSVGSSLVDSTIATSYLWYLKGLHSEAGYSNDKTTFNAKMQAFKAKEYPYYAEYAAFYEVYDFKDANGKDDVQLYMDRGTAFLQRYGKQNDAYTISLASLLGNLSFGKDKSLAGLQWMEDLLARNRDPRYLNTYMYLLWRNFHFDKALQVGQEIKANQVQAQKPTQDIDKQIEMVNGLKVKYGS